MVVAASVWLAGANMALALSSGRFPSSLDREPLLAWLERETDIGPDRVVAVTEQALTSIVSTFPPAPGAEPRVVIRAEALNAETQARIGALSWHVSMSADCEGRRVRLGETTGYLERNLLGDRKTLRASETEWRTPEAGTALDAAWRATCQTDFKGPFQTSALRVAQPDGGPATPSATPAQPASKAGAGAKTAGGVVVQLGALRSEAEARALIATLGASLGGREAWVETAQVGGKTWRRALVGGFADPAAAARFCADLKAAGRGCFVRATRAG